MMKPIHALLSIGTLSAALLVGTLQVTTQAEGLLSSASMSEPAVTEIAATSDFKPGLNRVTFQSQGEMLVGNLYLPATYQPGDKLDAVLVTGSWTTVKEQMAGLYAQKLSEQGFAALAFDFRYWGESTGEARSYESPAAKIQDITEAARYLKSLPLATGKVGGLGICASAGYMAAAIANGAEIDAFVTAAAWLHNPELVNTIYGGEAAVQQKTEAGLKARQVYEQTGQIEYVPAYSATDSNAAMSGESAYYGTARGAIPQWKNQFAVMSWPEWLQFDAIATAPQITVPTLLIHSEQAALPDGVRQFYSGLAGQKQLVWLEGQHFDFYDQGAQVNQVIERATAHFPQAFEATSETTPST